MTTHHMNSHFRQAGMTLVELLISITIGLFIIGAALMVFQSVSGVGNQISELTQLRQQGMHAFRTIGRQVREAGAVEPKYIEYNNNFRFENYTWNGGSPIAALALPAGADASAATLGISQQTQTSPSFEELILNCLGQKVAAGRVVSNFYVKSNRLMCSTGGVVADQPIVNNVHAFKVRYRVRSSAANRVEKQFVNTPINWSLVDAVEVCLDLIGEKQTSTNGSTYTNCDNVNVSRGNRLHVVQRNLFTVFSAQR